ncbi:hypothetical protein Hanom_Chr02g00144421 [Helianthus anomalus]
MFTILKQAISGLEVAKDEIEEAPKGRLSGDVTHRAIEEELLLVTLQDYKSRYISKLCSNKLIGWHYGLHSPPCALAICLRSNDTVDFNYAFEFICTKQ